MAFADSPVREVEYRDLYGLGEDVATTQTAKGFAAFWNGAVDRVSPLYLTLRGYSAPLAAKADDPAFISARTAFGAAHPVGGHAMTPDEFHAHVSRVLAVTIVVGTVAGGYVYSHRRKRHLRHEAHRIALADLSAYEPGRRRRRKR